MRELFKHQRIGVDKFKENEFFANFGDMGSGKSAQAIVAIKELELRNALILCPKSLQYNWESEFASWHPQARVWVYTGTIAKKRKIIEDFFKSPHLPKILVVNYDSLITKDIQKIYTVKWQVKVGDEFHLCKDFKSKRAKALKRIQSLRTWIMTGTPTPNNPLEIFGQFDIMLPGYLGKNFYSFRARYADVYTGHGFPQIRKYINLPELKAKVDRYSYRVTKEECLDLPPKLYQTIPIDLSPKSRAQYDAICEELVLDIFSDGSNVVATPNILTKLVKLQQITAGFIIDMDGKDHEINTDKADVLSEMLSCIDPAESIVIWCKFKREIEIIKRVCEKAGRRVLEISGAVTAVDRQAAVESFQTGDPAVMVANMAAGGVGITLTRSRTVFYYSRSFNAVESMQSEDRTHRIGARNAVTYYDLTCRKTIDEYILKSLKHKKQLADKITGDDLRRMMKGEL